MHLAAKKKSFLRPSSFVRSKPDRASPRRQVPTASASALRLRHAPTVSNHRVLRPKTRAELSDVFWANCIERIDASCLLPSRYYDTFSIAALRSSVAPINAADNGTGQFTNDSSGSSQQLTIPKVTNGRNFDQERIQVGLEYFSLNVGGQFAKQGFVVTHEVVERPDRDIFVQKRADSSSSSSSLDDRKEISDYFVRKIGRPDGPSAFGKIEKRANPDDSNSELTIQIFGDELRNDTEAVAWGASNLVRYSEFKSRPAVAQVANVIHGTTPGAAASIVRGGVQAGKDGGIWVSTNGGGVAHDATVRLNYNLSFDKVKDIPDNVIRDAQKAANASLKGAGLSEEARRAAFARAKGDYIAKWAAKQSEQVFRMRAPSPYAGDHYYIKPEAWKGLKPTLLSITGEGAEEAIKALSAAQVADEATVAAAAAAKARWAGKAVTALRVGGRIMIVVGIAASGYEIYAAENKWKETAKQGGGIGGSIAGGTAGGWFGTAGGPWGIGAGIVVGGIGGFFAGSQAGENYYEFFFEPGALFE